MPYLDYHCSIIDQIRDEIRLDKFYRYNDEVDYDCYDDASEDYEYTFDYAD
jgi:hypothetical protein